MAKYILGLDIGQSAIKAVVLDHSSMPLKIHSFGKIAAPQPGIVSDSEIDLTNVSDAIKTLIEQIKSPVHDVIIALPESRIFSKVIYDLPYLSDDELAQAIKFSAEEFVPMPIDSVNLNYQVLFRSLEKGKNSKTIVYVVATPKVLVDKYLQVLTNADLKPIAIETELIASSRSLVSFNPLSPPTLIVELNSANTDFGVCTDGSILLTRSIATGGLALTRAISQALGFEIPQAEEYKKVYGVNKNQLEGKLAAILSPLVDLIITEAKRVIQSHEALSPTKPIKRVLLSGSGAKLPGLVISFANQLGLDVAVADPWQSISRSNDLNAKLAEDAPSYSVAVGLAMRDI